jgi:2-phosphoglycerate kinase
MPETIIMKGEYGLPFSKGLMAQSLSASGLAPDRAYEVARLLEARLGERGEPRIPVDDLRELAAGVLREEEGEDAARRFLDWEELDRLERPLIVTLGGAPGVGKSTLATLLAARVGITRVIATDAIRNVIRAFFSHDFMPVVHYSSFEAGATVDADEVGDGDPDVVGYLRQVAAVRTGVVAIAERAVKEGTPMILEGVHLIPGGLAGAMASDCVLVEAVVAIEDEAAHQSHFSLRAGDRPAMRYLRRFEQIRKLQDVLVERARARGVPVIDGTSIDAAVATGLELIRDAVAAERSGTR